MSVSIPDAPATLSVPEAGRLLGVSRKTAYAAVARGEIPSLRIGGRILVPTARLRALLEDEQEPTPP